MKQKLNGCLILIAMLAVITTLISSTFVFYNLFRDQIRDDLHTEASLLAGAGIGEASVQEALSGKTAIRITWISQDGRVLYDNDVHAETMTNHMDRPEVQAAFASGSGESVRESDTLGSQTFYYALLLEDGSVLRVAKESRNLYSVYLSAIPLAAAVILLICVLCIVLSRLLTGQFLEPVRVLSEHLDDVNPPVTYPELEPFVNRIREQHEGILAAAKSRQDFTANVSHELKTPITAISGYAELIENRMVDEEHQVKFARDIRKSAGRLLALINDIIRLSELDHNQVPEFTRLDLYEIAEERVEFLKPNAREKNIMLMVVGSSCPVMSNRGMLIELIDNLVQNAIRYNVQNGRVTVIVSKSGNRGMLTVTDTGIGIPKADQERIFERFYRVDKSRSRETGGTGLGLAIVKHIVELHNGSISLESEPGRGTVMKIVL